MNNAEAQAHNDADDVTSDDHDGKHQEPKDAQGQVEAVQAAAGASATAGHVTVRGFVAQDARVGPLYCHHSSCSTEQPQQHMANDLA